MLHLTVQNFDEAISHANLPVIVMFYADWCPKCAMMKPVTESMEQNYHSQITFCKVNMEESPSLSEKFEIEIVPTFLFFKDRQLEASFSGIVDASVFSGRIQQIFRNC